MDTHGYGMIVTKLFQMKPFPAKVVRLQNWLSEGDLEFDLYLDLKGHLRAKPNF